MVEISHKILQQRGWKYKPTPAWLDGTSLWLKTINNKLFQLHHVLGNKNYIYIEPNTVTNWSKYNKLITNLEELIELEKINELI